jgi:hypothetical protein
VERYKKEKKEVEGGPKGREGRWEEERERDERAKKG